MSAYFAIQPLSTFLNLEAAQWNLIPDKLQTLVQKVHDCFRTAQPEVGIREKIEDQMIIFLLNEYLNGNLCPFTRLKDINGSGTAKINIPLILAQVQRELSERELKHVLQEEDKKRSVEIEENKIKKEELKGLIKNTELARDEIQNIQEEVQKKDQALQLKLDEQNKAIHLEEAKVAYYQYLPSLQKTAAYGVVGAALVVAAYNYGPGIWRGGSEMVFKLLQNNKELTTPEVFQVTGPALKYMNHLNVNNANTFTTIVTDKLIKTSEAAVATCFGVKTWDTVQKLVGKTTPQTATQIAQNIAIKEAKKK